MLSRLSDKELDKICGGTTNITGTLISALTDIIKLLYDAGHSVGSSIRRIKEKELCSIE